MTHRHEPVPKNEFLQSLDEESEGWSAGNQSSEDRQRPLVQSLDDSVEYWTDYLKAHLHPRSVYELPNTFHGVTPFQNYSSGQGFFKQQEQLDEVENRLRFFVEECDHLQVCVCFCTSSLNMALAFNVETKHTRNELVCDLSGHMLTQFKFFSIFTER